MIRCLREKSKKGIAALLSGLMVLQCGIPNTALGNITTSETNIAITYDETVDAVRAALNNTATVDASNFYFDGTYASEYEDLFGLTEDVVLYPLSLNDEKATASDLSNGDFEAYLKVNYSDMDEVEVGTPAGSEEIILLLKNRKNSKKKVTLDIFGEKRAIYIPGKNTVLKSDDGESIEGRTTPSEIASYNRVEEETTELTKYRVATSSECDAVELIATASNAAISSDAESAREISIYEPVLMNKCTAMAVTISADDIAREAYGIQYSFETESAIINASVLPDTFSEAVTLDVREFDFDEEVSMTNMLRSYGTLVTGTKSFDIHFLTGDGEEIEPNGPVEISITLKNKILPDDANFESLTAYHVTDENPISTIMNLTDEKTNDTENKNADKAPFEILPITVEESGSDHSIRFTANSFSYFVMSYNGFNNLWAYLYDEDGNQLPGTNEDTDEIWANPDNKAKYNPQDFCASWNQGSGSASSNGKWIYFATLTSLLGDSTTNYTYINAYTDSAMEQSFNWIYFEVVSGFSGNWWVSALTEKPTAAPSESDGTSRKITADADGYMKLYIRMQNHAITSPIEDHVEDSGYFLAKVPENLPKYATVNYKWYRSDDGVNFEEVVRKKAANKTYNIEVDTTGSKLYPSRDVSIDVEVRRWYKAEVYVDGELYKEYSKRQVQDYPCIMNGSFETPKVSLIGDNMYDFPNGTEGLYWRTTGEDKQIEVIKECDWAGSAYNCAEASGDGGTQWVELNAEKAGALYQHVLVQPESTLYWHFSHRGRNDTDTMYMVIAPKNKIDSASSTNELVSLAKKIANNEEGYTAADGYQTLKVEDGNTAWTLYEGEYTVPDDVWLLSFFFISASGTTLGNLIDDVSFSTTVPGPVEGCANITAVESLSGLLSDDIANLTMKVWLENKTGVVASDKNGVLAERTVSFGVVAETNGVYTKTVTFPNMPDDTEYTIKKVLYYNSSTAVPDGYSHLLEAYAVERNGVLEDKGDGSAATFMTYDEQKDKIHVDFVDRFEIQDVPITIKKELSGNAVEDDRTFTFTITGYLKNGIAITDELSDSDKTFTLKGGGSKMVKIPFGSYITVSEEDCSDDSYVTYHELVPGETVKGNTVTIPELNDEKEILFTNKRVKAEVNIKKVDEDGDRLAGATLTLYKGKNLSADKEIESFTTDGTNDWVVTLMNGDYTLVETVAPDGYRIADAIPIHVDESGVVTCKPESAVEKTGICAYTITMINKKLVGSIILENEINETYDPFGTPSFIYEITNKDGSYKKVVMLTMDSLKKNEALDLPAGEYTVKQIQVARYVPGVESMNFTVADGETVRLPFKNTITQYEKFSHVTALINRIQKS